MGEGAVPASRCAARPRPHLAAGSRELRLAATASLEAMAGVIALTYQRRLQGGDQTLT
jgi:hypothetical protein